MIKSIFKLILLTFLVGFITISPRTRFIIGVSLKQISSFLLWTVKNEDREKWIIDKHPLIKGRILKPSYKKSFYRSVKQKQIKD